MTDTYAVISASGAVENLIVWDGNTENWQPPEGCIAISLPEGSPVGIGWSYDTGTGDFIAPVGPPLPPPSETEIMAMRNSLLDYATQQINPLQDLVDIGESTPEDEALLLLWKKYRAAIGKTTSQPGWHLTVVWPVAPV